MSGVTGLVLAEAAVAVGVEAIALVGRHHPMLSDARAAVACLEVISRLVPGAGLAGGQLTRRAEKLERKIHRAVSDMTRTSRRRAPQSMYM
jgi:predicted ATP-grasp superfamily ATP-dependent carboligase